MPGFLPPHPPPPITDVLLLKTKQNQFCSPFQSPSWHNTLCKTKVTLRCQTFQCQHCLHACMSVPHKICHPRVVCFLSLNCWWFYGFLSCFKSFFIWSGWRYWWFGQWCEREQRLYALLHHIDAVRSRMKAEQGKPYSKADWSKQNGLAVSSQYLSIQGGAGGGGGGVLAVKFWYVYII